MIPKKKATSLASAEAAVYADRDLTGALRQSPAETHFMTTDSLQSKGLAGGQPLHQHGPAQGARVRKCCAKQPDVPQALLTVLHNLTHTTAPQTG